MRELPAGTLAIAKEKSGNRKIGDCATTYAAQASCPKSCRFLDGGGCYAENGQIGKFVTGPLNRAAGDAAPVEVALAEARAIDALNPQHGRPLRLHTVGDCATDEAAEIVAAACQRYVDRGGGPVWTYTHGFRNVARESWGTVSVLASCETLANIAHARARGYATAVVVDRFRSEKRYRHDGMEILPCPAQTRHVSCSSCRLCFDDRRLHKAGLSIGFALHGTPLTLRRARLALTDPDDPNRRRSSRELIPEVIAELEREGVPVTTAEIARRLGMNFSSVAEMRRSLANGQPAKLHARSGRPRGRPKQRLGMFEAIEATRLVMDIDSALRAAQRLQTMSATTPATRRLAERVLRLHRDVDAVRRNDLEDAA